MKSLISDLEATRHAVWADQELTGGDSWWQEILRQTRHCDVFVLALSNNSLRSKPCLAELDYARRLRIPVVPAQIGRDQPVLGQPPHSAGVPPQQLAGQHQWAGGQTPLQPGIAQGALAV